MTRSLRSFMVVTALVLAPVLAGPAAAGAPTEQLRSRIDRVVGLLDDGDLKARPTARREALRGAAAEIFDFNEITRRALGRHWQTTTPAEREELVHLLTARLERAYLGRIEQYSGERIAWVDENLDGDVAVVRTRLASRSGGPDIPVDYRVHRVGDRWLAYDVSVEGVSLVASYRAQFNRIIQTSSAQALVERLRTPKE